MFDYDEELPAGFQDADFLQRQYEEESRTFAARLGRAHGALDAGDDARAWSLCPHGGGYGLGGTAATDAGDPAAGLYGPDGFRCQDCGAVLDGFPGEVVPIPPEHIIEVGRPS